VSKGPGKRFFFNFIFTLVAVGTLPQRGMACEEDSEAPRLPSFLSLLPEEESGLTGPVLPTELGAWTNLAADVPPEEDLLSWRSLSLEPEPQGRLNTAPPFIDFKNLELGGFAGVVSYSSAFKARADYVLGVSSRVPAPGIPLGDWGIWAELYLSHIKRDLPFFYPDKVGNWFGLDAGLDYTFHKDSIFFVRGQAGVVYAYWNRIQSIDNGIGGMLGAEVGFFWIRGIDKAVLTINPQFNFDGKNYFIFIPVGFSVRF